MAPTTQALELASSPDVLNPVRTGFQLPLHAKEGVHVCAFMPVYAPDETVGTGDWHSGPGSGTKMAKGGYVATKVITVFPSNVGTSTNGHQGLVLLFSADNGSLLSMADAHEVTGRRTAAASAVATRCLKKRQATQERPPAVLALLGSGYQARTHLQAMLVVLDVTALHVWSRNHSRAEEFAAFVPEVYSGPVHVHLTAEEAVKEADVVCTLTPSREPILCHKWLKPGCHVNAVGSCHPTQQELDEDLVRSAKLFCDTKAGALNGMMRTGDLVTHIEKGVLAADDITELSSVLAGGYEMGSEDEITVFKSVGFACEDLTVAVKLYEKAQKEPVGSIPRM